MFNLELFINKYVVIKRLGSMFELDVEANADAFENLVAVMWANEQFNPNKPDTFFEKGR